MSFFVAVTAAISMARILDQDKEEIMAKEKTALDTGAPEKDLTRTWLALGVPLLSMCLLIIISAIYLSQSTDKSQAAQSIFNTTLPLIGTWVGTVLTFYFTSQNYDAAARNARAMVSQLSPQEKLQSTIVQDVWIPMQNAVTVTMDKDQKEKGVFVKKHMLDKLEKKGKERLPILDSDGRVQYVLHRSLIDRFVVKSVTEQKKNIDELTLQDMLDDEDVKEVITKSFQTVHATSNLADAKKFIDQDSLCSDVFATKDGTKDTKALGWVTNVIIAEQAKI
jgi:hypothetical protein